MNGTIAMHARPVKAARRSALPPTLAPRGLHREASAEYIGVSPSLFDEMVEDGRMPRPKAINRRRVWDLHALDEAFAALPSEGQPAARPRSLWDEFE